jgi:uncharacterized protein (TIGR03086 family)
MPRNHGHYDAVAGDFERVLRGVTIDQWVLPTPCDEWTTRQLSCHVIETHRRALSILHQSPFHEVSESDDVVEAWRVVSGRVLEARDDPALASRLVSGLGRDQNFASLVDGLLTFDTLCHTWDLARATGQDETLDALAVAYAHEALEPVSDALRGPGGYGAALEPAPGASAQTRFLNFTGRHV